MKDKDKHEEDEEDEECSENEEEDEILSKESEVPRKKLKGNSLE